MRVLLTGAAGYLGRHLTPHLGEHFELRLGDLQPLDDPRYVPLDVTRPEAVAAAVAGVDALVHLAIAAGHEGDFEDDAFNQVRFDVNVRGTFNVLEAARRAGLRRVVHTSSLMVVWGRLDEPSIASDAPPRPIGAYALTKQLGEVICEHYAREHSLSIVCLRIPKPISRSDARWHGRPIRPQWIEFTDLAAAYRGALQAPAIDFEIVTVVGDSSRRRVDLAKAERVLGYRPSVRLEDLGYALGDEREPF